MIYIAYKCKTCKKEFILLVEDVEIQQKRNRYLVCPYCSSKRIEKQKVTNSLRECMKERKYKRIRGKLQQIY